MLSVIFKNLIECLPKPSLVEDIVVGNVLQPGAGATTARMAAFHAGLPQSTSVCAINRQCSSGLQAVASVAASIKAGYIDIGIGAGVESMTHYYGPGAIPSNLSQIVLENQDASACLIPMGLTSENVSKIFNISRKDQDIFALKSHEKAAKAQADGAFKDEIVPVRNVSEDDGIRKDATIDSLSRLNPSFQKDGMTTPGNASQVSDGAAGVLLMRRSKAVELGLKPVGVFRGFVVKGCDPRIMGIGPVFAIPELLKQTRIDLSQIDLIELNEAFASQSIYCIRKLGLDPARVNPLGGAIALGHPLGATGSRQIATILGEMKRRNLRFGIVSMCIGTGMGAAALIERA